MSLFSERDNTMKIRTCRICLDANIVDMVILEEQNGWLPLFEFCFGLTLTSQDEPRLLCKICAEKVQSYVKFKEKCHKSHSLWQSVKSESDVKCYIVDQQNGENTNENANDPVISETQIKAETVDPFFDSDINFSNDVEIEILPLSSTGIKTAPHEDDTKSTDDESSNKKNEDFLETKVNSKQINCKNRSSHSSVRSNEKQIYTCLKCKVNYARKVCFLKHIKVCETKTISRRRYFEQDYAYDLGRQYYSQNIEVKHESKRKIEIIGDENENVSSTSCGLCSLSFTTTKDLCIHLNDHWTNNDLACKLCDFVGIDLAAIAAHRYSHFPRSELMRFLCHICENNQQSLMALHFHYRKEHLQKSGGYCSRCHKAYSNLRPWKKHELTHCTAKYICDICGRGFHFKHAVREHIINHMQINRSICDICGKTFARQNYMRLHKETVHCVSAPLQCTHCDRTFKSEFYLKKHQKNVVTREKTLKCEVCHKAFITPNTLRLHMVTHSDERPFICNICDCSYKYKSQLTIHQYKHYGFLPQCKICTKTFSNSMSLKRHSSVHTGVRQYSCDVTNCARTFHSKKLLLSHLELRHKNENGGIK